MRAGDSLAGAADMVRDGAAQLAGYRDILERLVAEPSTPSGSIGVAPRLAEAPLPGNAAAFSVLMVIWEAVPRLEARLRLEVAGHPGTRRGGSAGNFLDALKEIVRQSGGVDEDMEAWAARKLDQLCDLARRIPDIDEAQRWRPLRSRPCPYCGCYFLRVLVGAADRPSGHVECFGHQESGEPCHAVAAMGTDARGVPVLEWAGGHVELVPDPEGADELAGTAPDPEGETG